MNYLKQIRAFWRWSRFHALSSKNAGLYLALLECANELGWREEFSVPNAAVQAMTSMNAVDLNRSRSELVAQGLLEYKNGDWRGAVSGVYRLVKLYDESPPWGAESAGTDLAGENNRKAAYAPSSESPGNVNSAVNEHVNRGVNAAVNERVNESANIIKQNKDKKETNNKLKHPRGKPSLAEVRAFCKSNASPVSADEFWDFYESKGWLVGTSPMADWKAALRSWERKRLDVGANPGVKCSGGKNMAFMGFAARDASEKYGNIDKRAREALQNEYSVKEGKSYDIQRA